jgi:glycosyltransferase involved in cell wall biosynthesis
MRILLATDAWYPAVNGVVRTFDSVRRELERSGHVVRVLTPAEHRTFPCPSYPEIRVALPRYGRVRRAIEDFAPEAVHVAVEGPIGLAVRRWCRKARVPFTSSYCTHFPEYLRLRCRLPLAVGYTFLRWFHGPARRVLVATATLERELAARGFARLERWSRGVDTELFRPQPALAGELRGDGPRPHFVCVGRVAVEKNVAAFLSLPLPGTKVVVGDGPQLPELRARFPEALFTGFLAGEELARWYAAAEVLVFPSTTDTYGLAMLEALACGTPVAAHPVPGPLDVVGPDGSGVGVLDADLGRAAIAALTVDRDACRAFALRHSWAACADRFLAALEPRPAAVTSRAAGRAPAGATRRSNTPVASV